MQHTSYPDDADYDYIRDIPVQDVHVVFDPSMMAASHDYSCPVCREKHAILDLSQGLMKPCGSCKADGYRLVRKAERNWFQRFVYYIIGGEDK